MNLLNPIQRAGARTRFCTRLLAGAVLALGVTGVAQARVSLTSLAADIDEVRTVVCGADGDCSGQFDSSVAARLDAIDARADVMTDAICDLYRDAGTEPPEGLACSIDGELRLVGGDNPAEGRLEINFNEQWGTVCDDGFGAEEALVACRQLGFEGGAAVQRTFGAGSGQIFLDDVLCIGTESRLEDCRNRGLGVHNCSHFEDIGVRCTGPVEAVGDVRLADGPDASSGRLEVRLESGQWGSVCDDAFSDVDAAVACRELGFADGTFTPISATSIPRGTGAIALDDVGCTGDEQRLFDCPHRGLEIHNCSHFEDVTVTCSP